MSGGVPTAFERALHARAQRAELELADLRRHIAKLDEDHGTGRCRPLAHVHQQERELESLLQRIVALVDCREYSGAPLCALARDAAELLARTRGAP